MEVLPSQAKRARDGTKWTESFGPQPFPGFYSRPSQLYSSSFCDPLCFSLLPSPKASVMCVGLLLLQCPVSRTTVCSRSLLLRNKPLQNFTAYNSNVGSAGWQRLVSLPCSVSCGWLDQDRGSTATTGLAGCLWLLASLHMNPPQALPAHTGWLGSKRECPKKKEVETASKIYIQWNVHIFIYNLSFN